MTESLDWRDKLWRGLDRKHFEGIRSVERFWSIGINIYRLDDGRWWLDDVFNDIQGFVSAEQAAVVVREVGRHGRANGYQAELLTDMLEEYGTNSGRTIRELTGIYVPRARLSVFPGKYFTLCGEGTSGKIPS